MKEWDGVTERRKEYPQQCFAPIQKQLETININISTLAQSVVSQSEQYKKDYQRHQESLEKHEKTLYGNGSEGLTTRTKSLEGRADSQRWVIGFIIPVVAAIVVKILFIH